ncbi:hypothetical protein GVAV_001129 [Gurleya vavrai]
MQLFEMHEIPDDHIIKKTKLSFVFVNLRPFLKNHILVSPKRIVSSISDLTVNETNDLFNTVRLCTLALKQKYEGFTINLQDGKAAGQKVFHVHVHIVPRNINDLKRNDDIYLDGALDCIRTNRSYDEMKNEADELRILFDGFF